MVVYYTERSDKEQVKILTRSTGYDTIYTVQYAIIKSYLETESGVQWLNYITPTKTFSVFTLFFLITKPSFSIAIRSVYTVQYAVIRSYLETESGVQWLNHITPTKTFSVFTLFFLMTKPNFSIAISITHCKTLFPSILP